MQRNTNLSSPTYSLMLMNQRWQDLKKPSLGLSKLRELRIMYKKHFILKVTSKSKLHHWEPIYAYWKNMKEGELKALVDEAKDWIGQWFSDIHPWSPEGVDNERLTCMRCYGLPCHTWNLKFYEFISGLVGTYVCLDDETRDNSRMDVARFLIRTKSSLVLNESINVEVNDHVYGIKLVEDMHVPKRIVVLNENNKLKSLVGSSIEEGEDEDGA